MKIEQIKELVNQRLTDAGILVNENQSFFNRDKIIEDGGSNIMLIGPYKDAWVFIGDGEEEKSVEEKIQEYIRQVKNGSFDKFLNNLEINTDISVITFLDCISKLKDKPAPAINLDSTPISKLITEMLK